MARSVRIEYAGAYYHMMARGNRRDACTEKKQAFHDILAKCFVVRANSWENAWSDETPVDKRFRLEQAEADKDLGWKIAVGALVAILALVVGITAAVRLAG